VADYPEAGQPENSGQPHNSGQPRSNGQPENRGNGRPGGYGQPSGRSQPNRNDPVADFQRWLMKAGARTMANQVADQVKRTLGQEKRSSSGDPWDTATNELPPGEPPECQWCPVCQAARAARLGNPGGLGARLADAGGLLANVVGDAFSAFEQVLKAQDQNRSSERAGSTPPRTGSPDRGEPGQ
jgi:hypothetical protein